MTTTIPIPEREPRADAVRNRKRVIKAARECMARDGLDAQMEEIARSAKVGVGTVYRHFKTKDDLVEALAAERFERLRDLALEALAGAFRNPHADPERYIGITLDGLRAPGIAERTELPDVAPE